MALKPTWNIALHQNWLLRLIVWLIFEDTSFSLCTCSAKMVPLNFCRKGRVDKMGYYFVSPSVPSCPFQLPLLHLVVHLAAFATSDVIFLWRWKICLVASLIPGGWIPLRRWCHRCSTRHVVWERSELVRNTINLHLTAPLHIALLGLVEENPCTA